MDNNSLITVVSGTPALLSQLTSALNIPREILASDEEIHYAWNNLHRELKRIPEGKINVLIARMCVAVATGLFDSAINYIWNSAILELRDRVRGFGLNVVSQVLAGKSFDEKDLLELKDAELLDLCVKLNLITEEGYFFLNQCRDVRNNFSAAHPPIGNLDDKEVILFLSRCITYALANTVNPKGVDTQVFLTALKRGRFSDGQSTEWTIRIRDTHDAQREILFGTLHGIYCDPASSEETRLNALAIVHKLQTQISPKVRSIFVDRHSEYIAEGKTDRQGASRIFLEQLNLLGELTEAERHGIISTACKQLMSVHNGTDNFYNEPPFAQRLLEISGQAPIPESIRETFVETVLTCAVGNPYGYSYGAADYYAQMIRNFSPKEIYAAFGLFDTNNPLKHRVQNYQKCQSRFRELVTLISLDSVPTESKSIYNYWVSKRR